MAEIQLAGTSFVSESSGTITVNNGTLGSSIVFPSGTVVQTKVIKDSTGRGSFNTQGDTYTGVSIAFDNNLQNTNSNVLIESSLQVDSSNSISLGLTWATSSTVFAGNKIGVDGSTVQNLTQGATERSGTTIHGGHYSFMAYDSNISVTTPKTYYLWVTNPHTDEFYLNRHGDHNQAQSLGASAYYVGAATAVFKIIEIAG